MARALFASYFFLLTDIVSIFKEKVCNMSLLKSSNMFPISCFMKVEEEGVLDVLWLALTFFLNSLEWFRKIVLIVS